MTEQTLRALLNDTPSTGPLLGVLLVLPSRGDGSGLRALGALVRVRTGGFMVALPGLAEVAEFLPYLTTEEGEDDQGASYTTAVYMETVRCRGLPAGPCLLADVPWMVSKHFREGHPLRNPSAYEVLRLTLERAPCRPRRSALLASSEQWIREIMDGDTASVYVTGDDEMWPAASVLPPSGAQQEEEVSLLQQRITQLEAALQSQAASPLHGGAQAVQPPPPPNRGVLPGGVHTVSPQAGPQDAVERLRALAGVALVRLRARESAVREQRPERILEPLQQEAGLGVAEPAELEEGIADLELALTDPLQRMLALQMKQIAMLARQQQQRQTSDPLTAALSGSSDGQSAGSGSVKGCLAREAYLKLMQDHGKVALAVMEHASRELGIAHSQVGPGLMEEYMEKKCPLGDNRLLIQQAYRWGFAWETGLRTNDVALMGVASCGLLFIDQAAVDFGRTNLGWPLTALLELQFSTAQRNRRRQSLTPFSRPAAASWVEANEAFMKDLDYLETKIKGRTISSS